MKDNDRGLYGKFEVWRTDGSSSPGGKHARCRYFVLDLVHDKYAEDVARLLEHLGAQEGAPQGGEPSHGQAGGEETKR